MMFVIKMAFYMPWHAGVCPVGSARWEAAAAVAIPGAQHLAAVQHKHTPRRCQFSQQDPHGH